MTGPPRRLARAGTPWAMTLVSAAVVLACAEGAASPPLPDVTETGPPISRGWMSVPKGTICCHLFLTWNRLISSIRSRYRPSAWMVTCQWRPKKLKLLT